MNRVVFISYHQAPDRLTEFLASVALVAAVVGAGMAGWNSGGWFWALLYAFVMLIAFPFLLTFCTILFLAFYPLLAWPGTFIANQLGWSVMSPQVANRIWLQRLSVVALLIPILILLERNGLAVLGFVAGVATFGLVLLGLLIVLPALLLVGLFLYAIMQTRAIDPDAPTFQWKPPEPPKLPPPE